VRRYSPEGALVAKSPVGSMVITVDGLAVTGRDTFLRPGASRSVGRVAEIMS
jgi:hypothetical protein